MQTLVQQNVEIKEQLRIVTTMLQEVLRRLRTADCSIRRRLPESVHLSLKDYAELDALERDLESQQVHNELVRIPIFIVHIEY